MPNRDVTLTGAQGKMDVVAVITKCEEIDQSLNHLKKKVEYADWSKLEDLYEVREVLVATEPMLAGWRRVSLQATREDIVVHIAGLLKSRRQNKFATETDQYWFEQQLAMDIAHFRPSLYELQYTCALVRWTCKYPFEIAEVIDALKKAKDRAFKRQWWVNQIPHLQAQLVSAIESIEHPKEFVCGEGGELPDEKAFKQQLQQQLAVREQVKAEELVNLNARIKNDYAKARVK